jgi:hypothetical protein
VARQLKEIIMPITNFGTLRAAVAARAVRSDLDALIPDFVRAAHDVIANRLALCADLTVDAGTVAMPTDARIPISVWVDGYPAAPLTPASEAQMRGLGAGVPRFFRVDGTNLVFGPSPDGSYRGRLLYKPARDFFADDAAANTALTRYPFLYLYGAMAELFAHVRQAEERDRYLGLFMAGIEAACAAELEDLTAAGMLRPFAQGVI